MSKRDKRHRDLVIAAGWTSERARQTAENEGLIPILPPPSGYVVKRGRKPIAPDNKPGQVDRNAVQVGALSKRKNPAK